MKNIKIRIDSSIDLECIRFNPLYKYQYYENKVIAQDPLLVFVTESMRKKEEIRGLLQGGPGFF